VDPSIRVTGFLPNDEREQDIDDRDCESAPPCESDIVDIILSLDNFDCSHRRMYGVPGYPRLETVDGKEGGETN
jgi:hypothetical protein